MLMQQSRIVCLKLISVLVAGFLLKTVIPDAGLITFAQKVDNVYILPHNEKLTKLHTEISFNKNFITGIIAYKLRNDTLMGAFINEFGIKGFEFKCIDNKFEFINFIKPLNKWYIKKVLKDDLAFVFMLNNMSCKVPENQKMCDFIYDNNRVVRVDKIRRNKTLKTLNVVSDSVMNLENHKNKVNYKFCIINYYEL